MNKQNNEVWLDVIKWDADGLVPAIAQDAASGIYLLDRELDRLTAVFAVAAHGARRYIHRADLDGFGGMDSRAQEECGSHDQNTNSLKIFQCVHLVSSFL